MYIIHHPRDVSDLSHPGASQILVQRISEQHLTPDVDLTDIGEFIIVESGDTITNLEMTSGCAITSDLFGEAHYGSPDFVPCFEWLEHHPDQHCFEMAFIVTDDFFTVLLIPDDPGIDADLLTLCREYS